MFVDYHGCKTGGKCTITTITKSQWELKMHDRSISLERICWNIGRLSDEGGGRPRVRMCIHKLSSHHTCCRAMLGQSPRHSRQTHTPNPARIQSTPDHRISDLILRVQRVHPRLCSPRGTRCSSRAVHRPRGCCQRYGRRSTATPCTPPRAR